MILYNIHFKFKIDEKKIINQLIDINNLYINNNLIKSSTLIYFIEFRMQYDSHTNILYFLLKVCWSILN